MDTVDIRLPQLPAVKLRLHEDGDPYISPCLRRWRIWEPRETRFVLDLLRLGQHVVDVGANLGYYTVLMSHLVGAEGKVFAFEPEAGNFALLQTNLALNQCTNVVAERAAVADRSGTEMLSVSKMDKGDHRLGPAPGDREPHEVTTVSLDDYFRAFRTPVHFIKVDVQGAEPRVLEGMRDLIARNQHQLVCLLEFSPGLLTMANASARAYVELITALGGRIFWLHGDWRRGVHLTPATTRDMLGITGLMTRMRDDKYSVDIVVQFNTPRG